MPTMFIWEKNKTKQGLSKLKFGEHCLRSAIDFPFAGHEKDLQSWAEVSRVETEA